MSTETEESWDARCQRERQENVDLSNRGLDLQERTVAAQEQLIQIERDKIEKAIWEDGPAERFSAFYELPQWQQDFKLREEALSFATRLGGSPVDAMNTADLFVAYIKGAGPPKKKK